MVVSKQVPAISSAHLATPVRPQQSLVGKALSATRGLAPGGLGIRQKRGVEIKEGRNSERLLLPGVC